MTRAELGVEHVAIRTASGGVIVEEADLKEDHPLFIRVKELLHDGYAGVILSGVPGTSKTWFAVQIASLLTDADPKRSRLIQFHPSYQYEDFIEGFVPKAGGGFELKSKHLIQMCAVAYEVHPEPCVLVIDELSRSDPGRVFGEALTYVEMSKRNEPFFLASGSQLAIPDNLLFVATMNPLDRSVEALDVAFERRFARIDMPPDVKLLEAILRKNKVADDLVTEIRNLFRTLQSGFGEEAGVGHAYFRTVRDLASLERLWQNQLRFRVRRALSLDPDAIASIEGEWADVFKRFKVQDPPPETPGETPSANDDSGGAAQPDLGV